jgi:hypothetical protein
MLLLLTSQRVHNGRSVVERHNLNNAQRLGALLQYLVRSTGLVVVYHIIHTRELRLSYEVEALGAGIVEGWSGFEGEDVRRAVLQHRQFYVEGARRMRQR